MGCFIQGDKSAYCGESLDGEAEYGNWVKVDLSILKVNEILFVVSDEEWAMAVNNKCVGSGFVDFGPEGQPALALGTADNDILHPLPTMSSLSAHPRKLAWLSSNVNRNISNSVTQSNPYSLE